MKELEQLLIEVRNFFTQENIHYWLDCGTLLGLYRDKQLIEWEKDIDIGCWDLEISARHKHKIVEHFISKAYKVNIYANYISICSKSYVCDIKLYQLENQYAVEHKHEANNLFASSLEYFSHCLSSHYPISIKFSSSKIRRFIMLILLGFSKILPNKLKYGLGNKLRKLYQKKLSRDVTERVPVEYFNEFVTLTHGNHSYIVPKATEAYLSFRYGKDWRTPKADWVTARDDGAFQIAK